MWNNGQYLRFRHIIADMFHRDQEYALHRLPNSGEARLMCLVMQNFIEHRRREPFRGVRKIFEISTPKIAIFSNLSIKFSKADNLVDLMFWQISDNNEDAKPIFSAYLDIW